VLKLQHIHRWSAITHWLVAIFNVCDYVRYITDMTSETWGFSVVISLRG
jgi:hypothetical protein